VRCVGFAEPARLAGDLNPAYEAEVGVVGRDGRRDLRAALDCKRMAGIGIRRPVKREAFQRVHEARGVGLPRDDRGERHHVLSAQEGSDLLPQCALVDCRTARTHAKAPASRMAA